MTARGRPSDRNALWQPWRDRRAGKRVEITSEPQLGWYRAKRRGRYVAVQIDLLQWIDEETGNLTQDEVLVAFIDQDRFYGDRVAEIWERCCGEPISEEQAERLLRAPDIHDLTRQVIA